MSHRYLSTNAMIASAPMKGVVFLLGVIGCIAVSCSGNSRDFDETQDSGGAGASGSKPQAGEGATPAPNENGGAPGSGVGGATTGDGGKGGDGPVATGGQPVLGGDEGSGGAGGSAPAVECEADLNTDRRNCGECDNVCFAPNDCGGGECSVCAHGCAVLSAKLTSQKPRASFSVTLADYFDPPANPITMTGWVASGSKVVVSLVVVYEEGGTTVTSRAFDTNDWVTLTVQAEPAKGPVQVVDVRFHELGAFKGTTQLYVEEVTGIPNHDFEFERSAATIESLPVFLEDGSGDPDPDYVPGSVEWLGSP